jgi:hypothetical protein
VRLDTNGGSGPEERTLTVAAGFVPRRDSLFGRGDLAPELRKRR